MEVETRTNIILLYERPPMAKQSFRYRKDGIRYQPKEVQEERAKIIELTKRQIPSDYISLEKKEGNGIIISFTFYFDPPTQLKKHIKQLLTGNKEVFRNRRPDDDNLLKFYQDCLIGLVYEDDSLIVHVKDVKKLYSYNPKVVINITAIKGARYIY